jgi:predicted transcriptional regulator
LDSKDTMVVTVRVPSAWKRALNMVAADTDTTPTEIIRQHIHDVITTYRDGIFFALAVQESERVRSDKDNEARR